jgi:RNase H-like domain found in reverse transcriptase/Reverse transcriptase (RNA-dependent DNA polymerase)/Integrase zinc binding domain/Chromo (CHRromatin Organisation MOdifier) domain/Integrase core domain
MVGAAPFARLIRQGAELYVIEASSLLPSSTTASSAAQSLSPTPCKLPEEYEGFQDIFSKEEADQLPEHRPYDHKIPLQDGAQPPFGPVYNLSPTELAALRDYIDKNIRRGFITPSQSPCGAPILFVKKDDGTLRLCVDYRGLNKLTVKNRYPLPLINEMLDRFAGAMFFTKLDMREGYHRLRMAKGEEWKTAFRCRYGLYEYRVMPFGLCNAPGTFQHLVNDTFREYLDDFLCAYLDDLLIYSKTLKEHKRHVRQVLERCQKAGLHLKLEKCVFHAKEVPFVGFLVSDTGIRMDPAKVKAVTEWPQPQSVHDIQVFLGFANFYRRFIDNYSDIVKPLTTLLRKDVVFRWGNESQHAFETLKTAFTTAPILRHFDISQPAVVEVDASDQAEGGILSQVGEDGKLHPCAFYSRKFTPAELNYEIYDKELMSIVDGLNEWRHHLEGSGQQVKIYTDHKNLLWFTETKRYNRRQARWAEQLSRFDFTITYRPGKRQGKPDALSRRPDYGSHKRGDGTKAHEEMKILKSSQFDRSYSEHATSGSAATSSAQSYHVDLESSPETLLTDQELANEIRAALPDDQNIGPYLESLRDGTQPMDDLAKEYLQPFTMIDGIVLRDGLVYVPNNDSIKLKILKSRHDSVTAGHPGQAKTLELVTRDYFWPNMRQFVNKYTRSCDTCSRTKVPKHKPHGPLHPLPVPPKAWSSVSMDFIVELPESDGFNAVYVCVDRFTKMAHFIATTTNVSAEEAAKLYLRHVFKHHGLPSDVVSDRGAQFTSRFFTSLLALCDVKSNKSTAYHPQSDGQTERVNQVLEQYLRVFCDYRQDDWNRLLPLAEFTYNNAQHTSTKVSPFFANYGFHPRCTLKVTATTPNSTATSSNPAAEEIVAKFKVIHEQIRKDLTDAQTKYKAQYDSKVKELPSFKVGDKVWLSRRNISTTRPSAKLDYKRLGPFRITQVVGESELAFKLELPPTMRIHPVFHGALLEPYHENTIPGRTQPPPPPVEVEGEEEWEVAEILDSKITRNRLFYLVDWEGYTPQDRSWEPADFLENSGEKLDEYHAKYPQRPAPKDLQNQPRRSPRTRNHTVRFADHVTTRIIDQGSPSAPTNRTDPRQASAHRPIARHGITTEHGIIAGHGRSIGHRSSTEHGFIKGHGSIKGQGGTELAVARHGEGPTVMNARGIRAVATVTAGGIRIAVTDSFP